MPCQGQEPQKSVLGERLAQVLLTPAPGFQIGTLLSATSDAGGEGALCLPIRVPEPSWDPLRWDLEGSTRHSQALSGL